MKQKDWFEDWFDSPYYHILYFNRNDSEAQYFLDQLTREIKLPKNAKILDLGCGRGRHSTYLSSLGYVVEGVDLSASNITFAKQQKNDSLSFFRHDMRKPYKKHFFDAVVNLFSSFGYFEKEEDHFKTIQNVALNMKENGIFVIDFLNVDPILAKLPQKETKHLEGVTFEIEKFLDQNGFIVKKINVIDGAKEFHFQERVKALRLSDFEQYFADAKIEILNKFGNYGLFPYKPESSDRLIIVGINKSYIKPAEEEQSEI